VFDVSSHPTPENFKPFLKSKPHQKCGKDGKKYNCVIVLKEAVDIICGSWINADGASCSSAVNESLSSRRTQIYVDNFI